MNRTVRFPRMRQHGESRMPAAMLASYIPAARDGRGAHARPRGGVVISDSVAKALRLLFGRLRIRR
jgi:hypothetical protein